MWNWDIFCHVVDNFGDIGVSWRLCKQLHNEFSIQPRLWVDDLITTKKIIPGIDLEKKTQCIDGITICLWQEALDSVQIPDVVIEAFGCELPNEYVENMVGKKVIWINLEYLSAEKWVDEFHKKVSIHPRLGLEKYFYFPGFTNQSGGLIRESKLIQKLRDFKTSQNSKESFSNSIHAPINDKIKVSLFCYPEAPIQSFLNSLAKGNQPVHCFLPNGKMAYEVEKCFGECKMDLYVPYEKGNLTLQILPFLTQEEYDHLLSLCDLNFVRGEDSWIRALWSGQPFIWQPYIQDNDVHLNKLNAFLEVYAPEYPVLNSIHKAWSSSVFNEEIWKLILIELQQWKIFASDKSDVFSNQQDLVSNLVIFCKNFS